MSQRVVKGVFYAHGGQVFAFLDTNQPYDIPGCGALVRNARGNSSAQLGNITLRLVEDPKFPNSQAFAVLSDRRGVKRSEFEQMVRKLFHGAKMEMRWITRFTEADGQLFYALLAREILRNH